MLSDSGGLGVLPYNFLNEFDDVYYILVYFKRLYL